MKFFHLLPFLLPILGAKSKEEKCGYEACPTLNPSELHVHLVAHSHDDVGWLKTVDQYYFGQQMGIQFAGIQYIIDSVVQALLADPKRKFIQVETAFFHKWWRRQHDKRKEQVRQLVNNGQLVIVGGGWSMNDEAAAHYQSIIDQFTYGIRFMEDTLGKCARPKIGWQIDPFGHTREMASIFNEMGYDAIFFARLDYRDKKKRLSTRTAEMLWRGSSNVGQPFLFTHAMFDHYSPPRGFKFDILSKDDPLVTDIRSSEYNLKEKVSSFTAFVKAQSSNYTSNNIMMAMGDDFTYQDAHYNYRNLDTLIKAYEDVEHLDNKLRRIRLHYSTPNCYVKAVNEYAKQKGLKYKVKTDDFIPYASDSSSYWTGYYTSRPTQKRLERQGNNLLQVAKQLTSVGPDSKTQNERISELREAMSVMQHHDAITGTEKTKVAMDYVTMMSKAVESSSAVASEVLLKRLAKKDPPKLTFKSCLLANISVCEESRKQKFVAIVYNPLSRKVSHHVRLPVDTNDFDVIDFAGKKMEWQVTPSIDAFDNVPDIQKAKFDLVFFAEDLPALGAKIYYITNKNFGATDVNVPPVKDTFDLGDKETGAQLNRNTGFLKGITLHSWPLNLRQELMYYHGAIGNNRPSNRTSGAYVFRPDPKNPTAKPFTDSILSNLKVYKGKLVDEVHQTFDNAAKQIVRVYKRQKNYVEFDWLVGPIDIR
uniref:Alpha-mannosidase n=1 Tax=Photinus pyralis TaxID=7054 RepID=A0A1Y1KZL6_PHOPY